MRSRTFPEDTIIIEKLEELSEQEAHEREADNRISIIIIVVCFAGIILGTLVLGG